MKTQTNNYDLIQEFTRPVGFLCVILVILFLSSEYVKWLKTSKTFNVKRIEIEGNDLLTDDRITRIGHLEKQVSIWDINLKSAEKAIESVGYIDQVIVKRQLPGVIQVQIQEKKPVALLRHQEKLYCLDPEGQVLPSEPGRMYDLPVLSGNFKGEIKIGQNIGGQWVPKGLDILKRIRYDRPYLFSEVSEMILGKEDGVLIYTCKYGIPVYVGDDLSWVQIRCLDAILHELISENELQMTEYIDLRYQGQVFVGKRA